MKARSKANHPNIVLENMNAEIYRDDNMNWSLLHQCKNMYSYFKETMQGWDITEKPIRIYGKRLDIEVFFKVTKSYLKLVKELQGRSYDLMFAHTTIVFTRYIMLATQSRNEQDARTIGALFFDCCDEFEDIRFVDAVRLLIALLQEVLKEFDTGDTSVTKSIVKQFINRLPSNIKGKLVA
ncbi:hypothetical protein [Effusibacillus lacus]|nr:hypothetical protein [Effusibacillus lacus]